MLKLIKPATFKHWLILNILSYGFRKIIAISAEGSTSVAEYKSYLVALIIGVVFYAFYSFHFSRALFDRKNNIGGYVIIFLIAISVLLNLPLVGALFNTPLNN